MVRKSAKPHDATTEPARGAGAVGSLGLLVCGGAVGQSSFHVLPERATLVLGRAEDCGLMIPHASISRRHLAITGGEPATIEDLGSRNGTRVGGRTLARGEKMALEPGALVEAGEVLLVVQRASRFLVGGDLPTPEEGSAAPASAIVRDLSMQQLYRFAAVVAESPFPALLLGETGVGKELLAEAIHARSSRARRPFLRINCGALAESVLESALFGHERGAFTGALQTRPGLFEAADTGTVFLDEVGELTASAQVKLLRVLASGEVYRLGSVEPRRVDVRILAATNRDLEERIRSGAFREDLLYRINCITLSVPPLRERPLDLEALAEHFAKLAAATLARPEAIVTPEAMALLRQHRWPGNVRELRNIIDRAMLLDERGVVRPEHLVLGKLTLKPPAPETTMPVPPLAVSSLPGAVDSFEAARIVEALAACKGNRTHAAKLLGIGRRTLLTKLKLYGIQ